MGLRRRGCEPYAYSLLKRFRGGESVAELAASEGIPESRIATRLQAAQMYELQRPRVVTPTDICAGFIVIRLDQ